MNELELHRMLKETKKEFKILQDEYKINPSEELKFKINSKYLEVKLIQNKLEKLNEGIV